MHRLKFNFEKPYLFISYSSKDVEIIKNNVEYLQNKYCINLWYDEDLTAGEDWDKEALPKLRDKNCKIIIFYASEDALQSKNVKNELDVAKHFGKKIIPINFSEKSFNDILKDDLAIKYNRTNSEGVANAEYIIMEQLNENKTFIYLHEKDYYTKLVKSIKRLCKNEIEIKETDYNQVQNKLDALKETNKSSKVEALYDDTENSRCISSSIANVPNKGNIAMNSNRIKFKLYGKDYIGNQSEFMFKVFESVVPKYPDKLEILERELTSFSLTNYSEISKKERPSYFRVCTTFLVDTKIVCVGASYGIADKIKQIKKMLNLCGEDQTIFEVLSDTGRINETKCKEKNTKELSNSNENTVRTVGGVNFICFEKEYNGYVYSDLMAEVIKQLFLKYSDKIEKVINCFGNLITDKEPEPTVYFRTSKLIDAYGIKYYIGTSSSTPTKLKQIMNIMNVMDVNPAREILTINGDTLSKAINNVKK